MDELALNSSSVTGIGLLFLICMCVLTFSLQGRNALIPLLITTCYIPLGQAFVVAGLHFQFFRIVLLIGVFRAISRGEAANIKPSPIDRLFLYWVAATLVLGTLAEPSSARFINRLGEVYNALGVYFLVRCWIRKPEDVKGVLRVMAFMIIPLALSMIVEKFTTRNIFAVLGGVPETTFIREGRLRCQGAFRHPILAGTYGATLLPLFLGLWSLKGRNRTPGAVGVCSAAVVTLASASSGPLLASISVAIGFALWNVREKMRLFRRTAVLALVGLSLVMNAPVWYLISRVADITGGTGWHRAYLIDQAVNHFSEWYLVGSTYTAHWGPAGIVLPGDHRNMDITNHYIAEGLGGGLIKMGLFIALIVKGFSTIGKWTHPKASPFIPKLFIWSIGVALCAHCVSFISVSYFDQIVAIWYWLLAILALLAAMPLHSFDPPAQISTPSSIPVRPSKSIRNVPF